MSITKTLLAGVAGTVLLSAGAMASEPVKLSDAQLDDVTAGLQAFAGFSDTIPLGFGAFAFEASAFAETKDTADLPTSPVGGFDFKQEATAFAGLSAGFGPVNGFSLGGIGAPGIPTGFGIGILSTFAAVQGGGAL